MLAWWWVGRDLISALYDPLQVQRGLYRRYRQTLLACQVDKHTQKYISEDPIPK